MSAYCGAIWETCGDEVWRFLDFLDEAGSSKVEMFFGNLVFVFSEINQERPAVDEFELFEPYDKRLQIFGL